MNNPTFSMYHANARGTGSAIKMELRYPHGDTEGHIKLTIAPQATVGNIKTGTPSTFDWGDAAITVKLAFDDLTKMLQVFRGEKEDIAEGKGLYHRNVGTGESVVIKFRHVLETFYGYHLEITATTADNIIRSVSFFFNPAEALGISIAIENQLGCIVFGVPRVLQCDNGANIADVMKTIADA